MTDEFPKGALHCLYDLEHVAAFDRDTHNPDGDGLCDLDGHRCRRQRRGGHRSFR